jgi:DNA invertase Pin-like site-specific DNA recombinase
MKTKNLVYDTGAYVRLSKDDLDIDGILKSESNSVSNQRDILREYIRSHADLELYDIYVDDGFSGKDFERPEFQRMMEDIEAGKVNCVVVKDLSRFSRDSMEATEYQKRIFPRKNIRFIAIGDGFDSLTATSIERNLVLPVKNMVNEDQLVKTSQSIRMSQELKMKSGAFIGSFTAYGYKKSEADNNVLVIDEYSAGIVREIYDSKICGMSMDGIAKMLNARGVLSPMAYKLENGEKFTTGFSVGDNPLWSAQAVRRILMNEVYTGTLVQGKNSTIGFKSSKRKKNEDGTDFFVRVENTHEAIISKSDFSTVQRLLKFEGRWKDGSDVSIFNGVLMCGDCGTPMIRRTYKNKDGDKRVYICKTKNVGKGCTRHAIEEEKLCEIVLQALKVYVSGCIDYTKLIDKVRQYQLSFDHINDYDANMKSLREEYSQISADLAGFQSDLAAGIITQEQYEKYTKKYQMKLADITASMEESERIVKSLLTDGVAAGTKLEELKRTMKIQELDRKTLLKFVECIWVFEDSEVRLQIDFKFRNEIPALESMKKCYEEAEFRHRCEAWEVV